MSVQRVQKYEYTQIKEKFTHLPINQVEGDTDPLTNEFRNHRKQNTHAYQVARNELLAAQEELDELE